MLDPSWALWRYYAASSRRAEAFMSHAGENFMPPLKVCNATFARLSVDFEITFEDHLVLCMPGRPLPKRSLKIPKPALSVCFTA
jgi:hypothetical protein